MATAHDVLEVASRESLQGLNFLDEENSTDEVHHPLQNFRCVAHCKHVLRAADEPSDTTPFQCEGMTIAKTRSWVAPILRDFCEKQEASNGQTMAKLLGKPRPSTQVYLLPSYGSDEAKRTGITCVGGTAMRKLPNGWEQLRDR
jgi:hypothetical protein